MPEDIVQLSFAGCGTDEASRQDIRRRLHDDLISRNPVRLSPVEWRHYPSSEAAGMLAECGVTDDKGLLAWLAEDPEGREFVIGSVTIPGNDG